MADGLRRAVGLGEHICSRLDKLSRATRVQADRPFHVAPSKEHIRLVLTTCDYSKEPGVSHRGLTVTATNTMKVLRRHGIQAEVWPLKTPADVLAKLRSEAHAPRAITHVVASAPSWVQPSDFAAMCAEFVDIEFALLNHTGTAYLSIDKNGIQNIRACLALELSVHNMRVAWNNPRGEQWSVGAFSGGNLLLPNLYDTTTFSTPAPPRPDHDPLRIGSFGASRPWKNQLTAAEAAVQLARRLGVNLEFYVNSGRPERLHGGQRLLESRAEIFAGLPNAKLIDVPWAPWATFRQIVRGMDLLFSPSFDETFCVVVADGIAEGVPSVVTGAMEWAPHDWRCQPWDPSSVVKVAMGLLHDRNPTHDAREALKAHVRDGVHRWTAYLLRDQPKE